MNRKKIRLRLMAVLLSAAVLSACSSNALPQTNTASQNATTTEASASKPSFLVTSDLITYEKDDYYTDWKSENPNYIELSGTTATLKGSGATVKGSKITITAAGVYVLSGKLDNGQIIVDVQDKGTVKLVLNGAEINSSDNAPIYVMKAGKTIISLQEGTQSTVTDGEKYVLADASTDEPNAAIFSKANLTINGTGTLTVRGKYNNGITSKDDLKVTGGNINIYSKDDGLMGRDMLLVKEGNIKVEAGGDAVKATNDADASKGFVALGGGTFDLIAGADGIQAETSILIEGGKFNISSGGGSAKAPVKQNDDRQMGKPGAPAANTTSAAEEQSYKAIKAKSDITISGGTFSIDSADDSVHSNNSVNIAGGDLTITSGDDGMHADSSLTIKGGKINITKSYEGVESSKITFTGGETYITASDDGINAGGGADGSSVNGRPGQNNFSSSGNNMLIINGGYVSVDSTGDGLDSNGSIVMTGGTAVVSGPTGDNNGSLDYDGTFDMSGGFLIAAGSSGMAQAPSDTSKQYSIGMYYSSTQKAGTLIGLQDSKGNTIASFAPKKDYTSVVISSPELKSDTEYTLYSGGNSTGTQYEGGTKVVSFTPSSSVTWLDEKGVTTARSHGPGGGAGGPRGEGKPGMGGGPKVRQ
jgi:hypothetical protein